MIATFGILDMKSVLDLVDVFLCRRLSPSQRFLDPSECAVRLFGVNLEYLRARGRNGFEFEVLVDA